jgi:hypothetical protein
VVGYFVLAHPHRRGYTDLAVEGHLGNFDLGMLEAMDLILRVEMAGCY